MVQSLNNYLNCNRYPFKILLILFLTPITLTIAQTTSSPLKTQFLLEGGYEYGGVHLESLFTSNNEDQSLQSGDGVSIGAGGHVEFEKLKRLMFRSVLSYKLAFSGSNDDRIYLSRIPLHISAFYKINDKLRLGVGVAKQFNVKLRGPGQSDDINFSSRLSPRFELGYKWVGITYTPIFYNTEEYRLPTNALGMFLSFPINFKNKF